MISQKKIEKFCGIIWEWYVRHKRTLPWRDLPTKNQSLKAYQVLVSEIMLQQTQVSRVIVKWQEWLHRFPTIESLATASNTEVIKAWQGMGYNSRALRLRDMARIITEKYTVDGQVIFPSAYEELITLKGIGPYTAAAVCNFAYGIPVVCIDTNIRRIIHRTFFGPEDEYGHFSVSDKNLLPLVQTVLTIATNQNFIVTYKDFFVSPIAAEWHAAVMDYGSLVCTKISPSWDVCPLTIAGINASAYKIPVQKRRTKNESGRMVGATFIPNRIFRGRIVQFLREQTSGVSLHQIGVSICLDWNPLDHTQWLQTILDALIIDSLVKTKKHLYFLA